MKITVFVFALLVAGACFTHGSEVDAEIDSEMTTDYPSCVFSNTCAYGCWKALECPPGMSHYGDGSACQGGGRPNCDLSWCWNPNNNKVFIFFPNRAHFHLLIFFPSLSLSLSLSLVWRGISWVDDCVCWCYLLLLLSFIYTIYCVSISLSLSLSIITSKPTP